jgi:hypothetical protein
MSRHMFNASALTMIGAAVFALSLPPASAHAEDAVGKAWDSTKAGSEKAWDKTKSGSEKTWDKTKSGTEKAWDKTKSGSEKAWDKTKSGSEKAWDKTENATTGAAHDVGKWGDKTGKKIDHAGEAVGKDIGSVFSSKDK